MSIKLLLFCSKRNSSMGTNTTHLSLLLLLLPTSTATSQWNTLTGSPPMIIARGGFSGLFPDSSQHAYAFSLHVSIPGVALWCDVQLTKDRLGICFPSLNLEDATDISDAFPDRRTIYSVNGVSTLGYCPIDYTFDDISGVHLKHAAQSRLPTFDNRYPILTVDGVAKLKDPHTPAKLWLNIQHDEFYKKQNFSMRNFVLSHSRRVHYISSPEVGFLRSIKYDFNSKKTKLIFRFLNENDTDPSSNHTYGSLSRNLMFIKIFASGILVPKGYIWSADSSGYLQSQTSLVSEAHKIGLQVFVSDFENDKLSSFNYSHDPLAEYLQFIDNGDFSVDGVLSDFPITASEAIGCFSHLGTNPAKTDKTLIITKNGASGEYPGCTDLSYKQAILDGADVLDCSVQVSKDGTPFCLSSIDLLESSTIGQTSFSHLVRSIPEIKSDPGIFTFNLTWADIKGLTPLTMNPFAEKFGLRRNPKYKNAGTFVTLSDFLSLTKNQTSLSGILIIVENAAYLAENQGLGVTDAVVDALSKAGYDKPGSHKVYIQSTKRSVLLRFKKKINYEIVYKIDKIVGDASNAAVEAIKNFAGSVVLNKKSVFPYNKAFLTSSTTNIVRKLKASNLSVFVETFSNEFVSQAWDFFSDPTVEINSFIQGARIDGVITDFPKTANRYTRNKCLNLGNKIPAYMRPVEAGELYDAISHHSLHPHVAPLPTLTSSDVIEPPLPPVVSPSAGTESSPGNAQPKSTVYFLSIIAVCLFGLAIMAVFLFGLARRVGILRPYAKVSVKNKSHIV